MIRDCGIKPNTRTSDQPSSSSLFSQAVASRKLEIIGALVATNDQYTDTLESSQNIAAALCMAIEEGDEDITRELVGYRDCNVNIGDNIGDTPLHKACRGGYERITSLLLKVTNCDINIRNKAERTAFHEAMNSSHFSVAKMLLGTGECNIDTRDTLGNTPLHTAVRLGPTQMCRMLLETGKCNINIGDQGCI